MYRLATQQPRQARLPLPSAALVVDLRGSGDRTAELLRIEIADLASEMHTEEIHHWRYLSDFLEFWSPPPLSTEEIKTVRPQPPVNNGDEDDSTRAASATPTTAQGTQMGPTGTIPPKTQRVGANPIFYQGQNGTGTLAEEHPKARLTSEVKKIIEEADRLRNNRAAAITDLDPNLVGPSIKEKTVRVILLVDAEIPNSLATASAYAAHLQQFNQKQNPARQELMISPTVLCLNSSGEADSSELSELLWEKKWDHLDGLIINERYRHDGIRLPGAVQTYLAELLLYVLLIVPPLPMQESMPADLAHSQPTASQANASTSQSDLDEQSEAIAFPANALVIGLATMEYSSRWARHLLNFYVVERTIKTLQNDCAAENESIKNVTRSWFDNWKQTVKDAIPHHVPETITGIRGLTHATDAMAPPAKVFTVSGFSWSLSKTTSSNLRDYLQKLVATYTIQVTPQDDTKGLQEAVDSIPRIEQQIRTWEGEDNEQRKEIPLARAQMEAQRVLSQRNFFTEADGAIPRAKMQLEALSGLIRNFRSGCKAVNLQKQAREFETRGQKQIVALEEDIDSLPRLCTLPIIGWLAAWATFLILLTVGVFTAFVGLAWLHTWLLPTGFTPLFNDLLLYSISPWALAFWVFVLAVVLVVVSLAGQGLVRATRKPWDKEIGLVVALLVLAMLAWIVSVSLPNLRVEDAVSFALLEWLAFLPTAGTVALILIVLIALFEIGYFVWWLGHLQRARRHLINEWNGIHRENIDATTTYIADSIALFLLERTELINENGEPGPYYERLNKLNTHLKDLLDEAKWRQDLAKERLDVSFSEHQPGTVPDAQNFWLNLRIRDERLDASVLSDGYMRLTEQLGQDIEELRDLAEQLLRAMGQERPAQLEKEFRERPVALYSLRHFVQVLMTTLVATAQRITIHADTLTSIEPLLARYRALENSDPEQLHLMKALIDSIHKNRQWSMLRSTSASSNGTNEAEISSLSINAFETWGQMLWQGRDHKLDQALSLGGVMPKVMNGRDKTAYIKKLFGLRASLFAQNVQVEQTGTLYMLIPFSPYSHEFRQSLRLSSQCLVEFPDAERLILLYIQRYAAPPMRLQIAAPAKATPPQADPTTQGTPTDQSAPDVSGTPTVVITASPPNQGRGTTI